MTNYIRKNSPFIIGFVICIIVGIGIGRFTKAPVYIRPTVLREDGYKYINPVLLCNINANQSYNEDIYLSKKLEDYSSKSKNTISVYYLSLAGNGWASINGDEKY